MISMELKGRTETVSIVVIQHNINYNLEKGKNALKEVLNEL
jgi:hypothetical protein